MSWLTRLLARPKGPGRETRESQQAGAGGSLVREITDSVVFEYSLVSRPSYSGTGLDVRADEVPVEPKRRAVWWL